MKKRFVWLGVVSLVAIVGWFLVGLRPAQSRLGELRADVESARQEVSNLQAQLKRLLALKRNEAAVRAESARMATALPSDPKVSDFIIQVQDVANNTGIDFLTITPSLPAIPVGAAPVASTPTTSGDGSTPATPAQPTTPLRSISVQIKADGGFFEIEQFVLRLEHLGRALRIDDFGLNSAGEGDGLSATMTLQIFMVVPQAAAGTGSAGPSTSGTQGAA